MNIFEELEKKTKRNAGYNDCPIGAEYYDESYEECEMLLPSDVKETISLCREEILRRINGGKRIQVVNGKVKEQRIMDFREGEEAGRDAERRRIFEIIDEVLGEKQ